MKNSSVAVNRIGKKGIIRDACVGIVFSLSVGFITATTLMLVVLGLII